MHQQKMLQLNHLYSIFSNLQVGVDSGVYKIRINFKPDNYTIGRNFFGKEFFKDGKDTITVDVLNGIKN